MIDAATDFSNSTPFEYNTSPDLQVGGSRKWGRRKEMEGDKEG